MNPKVDHAITGDRVLISATFPIEALTSTGKDGVTITLDDQDWYDASKRVLRECNAAERGLDGETVAMRVEQSLSDAVVRALAGECEPVLARRRAVASALHRLADMVVSGTVMDLMVEWPSWKEGDLPDTGGGVLIGFGTRRVNREVLLSLRAAEVGG